MKSEALFENYSASQGIGYFVYLMGKSAFTPAGKKGWHESCLANPHVPSSRDVPAAFHPLLPMKTLSGGNIPA